MASYELKLARFNTCEIIFKEIVKNYSSSLPLQVRVERNVWIVRDGEGRNQVRKVGEKLECDCSYMVKSGLPCIHLHKVIREERHNLMDYVAKRWKLEFKEVKKQGPQINLGRPRLSRKNRG